MSSTGDGLNGSALTCSIEMAIGISSMSNRRMEAAMRASEGQIYRYPLTLRLLT